MVSYLVRRILWGVVLFFVITVFTFVLFFVLPVERARLVRRTETGADIRMALNVHGPIYQEYGSFVWNIVRHGSLGRSFANRQDVTSIVAASAPVTASIVIGGAIIFLLIAIPVGILSALRPRSLLDRTAMTFVLIGISAHPVWIGLILSWGLGYRLHWTPIASYCDFFSPSTGCGGPVQWAYHLLLPWLTFAILFAALYVRMIRATVVEAMDDDYVRTARAKGAPEWRVLRSHVLRNAMLPVVTMLGMDAGVAFGGALFVETIYTLPGIGRVARLALVQQDLPTILGVVIFVTTAILVFNLLVDLVYAWIDPRIRIGAAPTTEEPRSSGALQAAGVLSQRAQTFS